MSSIYDNKKNAELLDGGMTPTSQVANAEVIPQKQPDGHLLEAFDKELASYKERSANALALVDDIVLKNYLTKLSQLEVVPCTDVSTEDVILFKINKMVYERDEYATDKFISVVSAMTYTNSSIYP